MRKINLVLCLAVTCLCVAWLSGCQRKPVLNRYDAQFLSLFDTVTSVVGYAEDKQEFTDYVQAFHDELLVYHQLYDIYHDYDGINNLKTINDNAGISPVKVDSRIIDLIEYAKEMDVRTGGRMNIAMGSVLSVWHEYRTEGIDDPANAELPPMDLLREESRYMDISKVIVDKAASTVYLEDSRMSLDVGAIGKGYATEQAAKKLEADGLKYALISVGGNVRAIGTKGDETKWTVGIQNPDLQSEETYLHKVRIQDQSLVSSGTYQRYYTVDGKTYHHIINPDTLMPSEGYSNVSILCDDSGMADALSTAVFNLNLEDGKKLIESFDHVEAMWVLADGSEVYSSGFKQYIED